MWTVFINPANSQKIKAIKNIFLLFILRIKNPSTMATIIMKLTLIKKNGSKYPADLRRNKKTITKVKINRLLFFGIFLFVFRNKPQSPNGY